MAYAAILGQKSKAGILPQIIITSPSPSFTLEGVSVTLGQISYTVTQTSTGAWQAEVSGYGTYTISGTYMSGDTELGFVESTIEVTENAIYETSLPLPLLPTLNDNTWQQISEASNSDLGSNFWAVGDTKEITLNGTVGTVALDNYSTWVYIIGFNHNSSIEGNGITFGSFKTALSNGVDIALIDSKYATYSTNGTKYFNMNHSSNTTSGGWKGCDLRYDVLGSTNADGADAGTTTATSPVSRTLMAALPSELHAVMKPMTIYTDNTGDGSNSASNVTSSVDYLPLLAEYEIFGTRTYANSAEKNYQAQYAYYSAGNSKVKYRYSATSSTAIWWERSPIYDDSTIFCSVQTDGTAYATNARNSYGIAPIFRV